MEIRNIVSAIRSCIAASPVAVRDGVTWWLREWSAVLPERVSQWIRPQGRNMLAIGVDQDDVLLELLDDCHREVECERIDHTHYSKAIIDQFLMSRQLDRKKIQIGLRLPREKLFVRKLMLPTQVGSAIGDIVAQDVAKRTPFKTRDIYFDYNTERIGPNVDKFAVSQWIIKRCYVEESASALELNVNDIGFVVAEGHGYEKDLVPFIRLRAESRNQKSLGTRVSLALACATLVLAFIAGGVTYLQQQQAMDELAVQIAKVTVKAKQVRGTVDRVKERELVLPRLRADWANAPRVLDAWDEMSRLLPTHTWVSEFRFNDPTDKNDQEISITGYSSAAPSLVSLIDGSGILSNAWLTAPVTFDATEGRERFALQAKLNKSQSRQGVAP